MNLDSGRFVFPEMVVNALLSCNELKELLRTSSETLAVLEVDIGKQVEAEFKA